MRIDVFSIFFLFCIPFLANAEDTLRINLAQADYLFQEKNFSLLASQMNIDAQKAQALQAKAYPNPLLTTESNFIDPENKKIFHIGKTGDKSIQLEQLILLGGKRRSEILMANTNTKIAELEFLKLLKELKFQLHTNLFTSYQQQQLLARFNKQLELLNTLLTAYEEQAIKGNIPMKEVVRLKGAYLKLNNDKAELMKEYLEIQNQLQILLQTNSIVKLNFQENELVKYIQLNNLEELKQIALENRTDLLIIKENKNLAEQYFNFQKKIAIPDINIYGNYSQRGGAFSNQINIGVSMPLPIWNKNQGNIKTAHYRIKEAEYNFLSFKNELFCTIQNTYLLYSHTVAEYQKANILYNEDFEITVQGMTTNFQKRNVNIIEFIDFFEAYNDVITELSRIKTQLFISGQQLNLLIGKEIY